MAKKIIKPGSPKVKKALKGAAIVADAFFNKESPQETKKARKRARDYSSS